MTTARALHGDGRKVFYGLLLLASAIALMLALGTGSAFADQSAKVSNNGKASADTGGNVAIGNVSDNEASNDQDADADADGRRKGGGDAVAINDGGAINESDGTAVIETGDAHAAGVVAQTSVNQEADGGSADQSAKVSNTGKASADTGDNVAIGNASDNEASNDQDADADADGRRRGGGDAVASNHGGAINDSDGTAIIETGDAEAIGVLAHTAIDQESTSNNGCCRRSFGDGDQSATVRNTGKASADTGDNVAIGNASDNEASNDQDADADADGRRRGGGDAVAINDGGAINESDGTAIIETGDARAAGVVAETFISQVSETDGCCRRWSSSDQSARVVNKGKAHADTGGNFAIGNESENEASNEQDADADVRGRGDAVASNHGGASNSSDGTAHVVSGDAEVVGTLVSTFISQVTERDCDRDCKRDRCDRDCKRDRCDRDCKRDRCDRDCNRDRCDRDHNGRSFCRKG